MTNANTDSGYTSDNLILHVAEQAGWGDLVNVGHFTAWDLLLTPVLGLGPAQRRLLRRSLDLLDLRPGQRVLDAGCGRGQSTSWIAERGCSAVGVDVQPGQIEQARSRFGGSSDAQYAVADATALPSRLDGVDLPEASFDRVHCLEAAFHFGAEGRRNFLAESFRLLRPGGRLALADFTWRETASLGELDTAGLVRTTWGFHDVEPLDRYLDAARGAGFAVTAVEDWTRHAVRPQLQLARATELAARTAVGRAALRLRFPGVRELSTGQWRELADSLRAHREAGRSCGYSALALDKPA